MLLSFSYQNALVSVVSEAGIAHAVITGEITKKVAGDLIADSGDWSGGRLTLAQSVDYSGARVLIDAEHFMSSMVEGIGVRNHVPTAIAANGDQLRLFELYASMARGLGIPKDAFSSSEAARNWAIREAAAKADRLERRFHREAQRQRANISALLRLQGPGFQEVKSQSTRPNE